MGLRGIGVLYSFTHGNPGYCLSFIKIITSITPLLPRLQVFVRITPSTPSRAGFKRPEGTATTGALSAAGPGARGPRVETMPLKRFRWAGSGWRAHPAEHLGPLQPGHEEQPRLPREETRLLPLPSSCPGTHSRRQSGLCLVCFLRS